MIEEEARHSKRQIGETQQIEYSYSIRNKDQFALYLKQAFGNYAGNTINYIADLIRTNPDNPNEKIEVFDNLFSAIVEHPFCEVGNKFEYNLEWTQDRGEMKLKSQFGFLDEMYREGIENNAGQIPQFEIERNKKNQQLYEKLKKYRSRGMHQPVVEFSPSPKLTPEALARGYKGYDSISVYTHKEGREVVEQYFVEGQNISKYVDLFLQSGITNDPLKLASIHSDTDVMDVSDLVNENQLQHILNFAATNSPDKNKYAQQVKEYAHKSIAPRVKDEIFPLVHKTAEDIVNGKIFGNDINQRLDEILSHMARIQLELYLMAKGNQDDDVTLDQFKLMTIDEQMAYLEMIGYEMSGCGFSEEFESASQIYGKTSNILSDAIRYPISTHETAFVRCKSPMCEHMWIVTNGDKSTYYSNCPKCNEDMTC